MHAWPGIMYSPRFVVNIYANAGSKYNNRWSRNKFENWSRNLFPFIPQQYMNVNREESDIPYELNICVFL